ncbi:hypothetical protein D1007_18257 [Hordeum vulgare]|nr:hypothetical protein D1007_18257 [Hordeum vulgare]
MAPGPCTTLSCYGHGFGVPTHSDFLACTEAQPARRRDKLLCQSGRAEELAYVTVFVERLDLDQINVVVFYSPVLYRGLGHTRPFVHRLTLRDVETYYNINYFIELLGWKEFVIESGLKSRQVVVINFFETEDRMFEITFDVVG